MIDYDERAKISKDEYEQEKIEQKIIKLESENKKLKECLEFYADENNWIATHAQQCPSIGTGEDVEDFYPDVKCGFIGGRLARKTLKEITV